MDGDKAKDCIRFDFSAARAVTTVLIADRKHPGSQPAPEAYPALSGAIVAILCARSSAPPAGVFDPMAQLAMGDRLKSTDGERPNRINKIAAL